MKRRITITLDEGLEAAISEAPDRLGLDGASSDSERLREYARLGYATVLQRELDERRLATYREWADDPELIRFAEAAVRAAAQSGLYED